VMGVEITSESVKYASLNAEANSISNTSFVTGSADKIFEVVSSPPEQTALIIDPPRKVFKVLFVLTLRVAMKRF